MKNFADIGAIHPWRIPLGAFALGLFALGLFALGLFAPSPFAPKAGSAELAKLCSTFPQPLARSNGRAIIRYGVHR